ncbi:hypothetical protein BC834DRAFT_817656 [Gloeopeniophorella convolvens]|nr:hypothetical protein BC834DRAFT_817656 [Gloeopeniophorella convolvens]
MRGRSWKALASASSSRLSSFKEYIAQRDLKPVRRDLQPGENGYIDGAAKKQSWTQWAGQKLVKKAGEADGSMSMEKIVLLPGWASRRYRADEEPFDNTSASLLSHPYDIEVFVSGYAVKYKAPGALSRSQRTLLKLAKSFAALPKLPGPNGSEESLPNEMPPLTKSTEDLLASLELPPRPEEITEESEIRALLHSRHDPTSSASSSASSSPTSSPVIPPRRLYPDAVPALPPRPLPLPNSQTPLSIASEIQRLHANLESRLHPFWAGVLGNRTVRVSLRPRGEPAVLQSLTQSEYALLEQPLAVQGVVTDVGGAFKIRFIVPWENLCTHPRGAAMAFEKQKIEHELSIVAELMPPPPPPNRPQAPPGEYRPRAPPSPSLITPTTVTEECVSMTYSPIRVISDIDDTVKLSGVVNGARTIFHNVFVKDLKESLIPGMGEWYNDMYHRGVRFHYVSNGPFELLPVINEFFQLAKLPSGSIRLRSYGTRSLFSGLLSAPGERKREGVLEVLSSFSTCRFILIGDSGEQDLELYAAMARDHPDQVACIFIRDANTYDDGQGGIEDPTGTRVLEDVALAQALQAKKKGAIATPRSGRWSPKSVPSLSIPGTPGPSPLPSPAPRYPGQQGPDYFSSRTPSPSAPSSATTATRLYSDAFFAEPQSDFQALGSPTTPGGSVVTPRASMSESDKKRASLQVRVWRARAEVPRDIVFRVFREPAECVEADYAIGPRPEPPIEDLMA